MQIQITSASGTIIQTVVVAEIDADDVIMVYQPCAYCGRLVKLPRKTCSDSCRALKSVYGL